MKKSFFIIIFTIGIILILLVLQYGIYYYNNPLEEEISFITTGCIIRNPEGKEWKMVDVEIKGKKLHYIFKNHREAAQGDILINGYSIFGNTDYRDEHIGFYTEFHGKGFGCIETKGDQILGKIIVVSEDFQFIVCGISMDPFIINGEKGWDEQVLLVIPGNDIESVKKIIKTVSLNSEQMREWLLENEWNKLVEIE